MSADDLLIQVAEQASDRAFRLLQGGRCFHCGEPVGLDDSLDLGSAFGPKLCYPHHDRDRRFVPIALLSHMDCDVSEGGLYWIHLHRLSRDDVEKKYGWLEHVDEKVWRCQLYTDALRSCADLVEHLLSKTSQDGQVAEEPDPNAFVLPLPIDLGRVRGVVSGVYAVQSGGFVKIGRATNVVERVRALQTAHPKPLRLLALLSRDPEDEKLWHREFKDDRCEGEWFRLTDRLAGVIRSARRGAA